MTNAGPSVTSVTYPGGENKLKVKKPSKEIWLTSYGG